MSDSNSISTAIWLLLTTKDLSSTLTILKHKLKNMSIILGIDPWTTTTWFAILAKNKWEVEILDYWIIETVVKADLSSKLSDIWEDIGWLIKKYKPEICWVEKLFFLKNLKTWIDVAHARWVILYELVKNWIKFVEFTPLQVKQGICWNWHAQKKQVQNALKNILKLDEIPRPDDAADALAIAYLTSLIKM